MRTVNEMESKTIGRPVEIRLHSSIQHPGQEKEIHEIQATGRVIEKANSLYLQYAEEQNGNEIKTLVKMGKDEALIMRSGAVTMRLPFEIDRERPGEYGSGPANMKLIVKTNELEFKEESDQASGRFGVNYELHAQGSRLGTYEITITYSEGTII